MAQQPSLTLDISDRSSKLPAFGLDMFPRRDMEHGAEAFWANYVSDQMGLNYFTKAFSILDVVTPKPSVTLSGEAESSWWFHGAGDLVSGTDNELEYWALGSTGTYSEEFTRSVNSFGHKWDWCFHKKATTSAWWATSKMQMHPNAPMRIRFCPYEPKDNTFIPEFRFYFGRKSVTAARAVHSNSAENESAGNWRYYLKFTDGSVELYRWDDTTSAFKRAAGGDILTGDFYGKQHVIDVFADRANRIAIYNAQSREDGFFYREADRFSANELDSGNFAWMWLSNYVRFRGNGCSCIWLIECSYANYDYAGLYGPVVRNEALGEDWVYDHTKIFTRITALVYPKTAANDEAGTTYLDLVGNAPVPPGGAGHPWIVDEDQNPFSDTDPITTFRYYDYAVTVDRRYWPVIARTRIRFEPEYGDVAANEVVLSNLTKFTEQRGAELTPTTISCEAWDTAYDNTYPCDSTFFERGSRILIPCKWQVDGSDRGYGYIDRAGLKLSKVAAPGGTTVSTIVFNGRGKDRWKALDLVRLGDAPVLDGETLSDALAIMLEAAGIDSSQFDIDAGFQDYTLPDAESDNEPKLKLQPRQTVGEFLRYLLQNYYNTLFYVGTDGKFHLEKSPYWPVYDSTYAVTQNFYFENERAASSGYYSVRSQPAPEFWVDESKFYNYVRLAGWDPDTNKAIMTQDPAHYAPSWLDPSDRRYIGRMKKLCLIDLSLNSLAHVTWVQQCIFERVSQMPFFCRFTSKHEPTVTENSQITLNRWTPDGTEVETRWRVLGMSSNFSVGVDDATYECQRVGWNLEEKLF